MREEWNQRKKAELLWEVGVRREEACAERRKKEGGKGEEKDKMPTKCVPVWLWCIVYFYPVLLWKINMLSGSLEAEGHYCLTNAHTRALWASCVTDSHLSLSPSVFLCCRENTGVNHDRQYRLKMQSPPGAQGHWRLMGGRKCACYVNTRSVHNDSTFASKCLLQHLPLHPFSPPSLPFFQSSLQPVDIFLCQSAVFFKLFLISFLCSVSLLRFLSIP